MPGLRICSSSRYTGKPRHSADHDDSRGCRAYRVGERSGHRLRRAATALRKTRRTHPPETVGPIIIRATIHGETYGRSLPGDCPHERTRRPGPLADPLGRIPAQAPPPRSRRSTCAQPHAGWPWRTGACIAIGAQEPPVLLSRPALPGGASGITSRGLRPVRPARKQSSRGARKTGKPDDQAAHHAKGPVPPAVPPETGQGLTSQISAA